MSIFAIADLHLSHLANKPMDIFGKRWERHEEKIKENWEELVKDDDLVIIAGDISWASNLTEVLPDLVFINDLPGKKILLRGNHDYWWQSLNKLKRLRQEEDLTSLEFLQNDAFLWQNKIVICGSRGWLIPDDPDYEAATDERIYKRELIRLKISLDEAKKLHQKDYPLIAAMHYPPFVRTVGRSGFTDLLEEYEISDCVFGHIHHPWTKLKLDRQDIRGVRYSLVACDQINFTPKLIIS